MNRSVKAIVGLAVVAGVAIYVGRMFLKPATERAQAKGEILSGAYAARVEFCDFAQDTELPQGVEPPSVGSDERYIRVVVLFPEVATIRGTGQEYRLVAVNGEPGTELVAVHSTIEAAVDGVLLTLTYPTTSAFVTARLVHGKTVVVENVAESADS